MPILKNGKHELFAQELAKGKTADEAYILAGYKENRGNAATLKAKQNILDRVHEIQSRGAERAEVTVASILAELEEARELAKSMEQASPMVAASMGKAKIAGILVDRSELTGKDGGPIQTQEVRARDEIARRIAGLAARGAKDGDTGRPN